MIRFEVKGKVIGAARPRVTSKGTYIPKRTRDYRKLIQESFKSVCGQKLTGALSVSIHVYRKLPKGRPKKVFSEHDIYKPDVDNISKNVLDALNGLAFEDDKQVVDLHCTKYNRTRIDEEYIVVTIRQLSDMELDSLPSEFIVE